MDIYINWLGNLSFAFIFAILGLFMTFLHIPQDEGFKYYRYSRYTLGSAFFILAVFCCIRPLLIDSDRFTLLSFELFFSLLASWLTYSSFLFIIYTERFKRRRFFLDGIIPVTVMLVSALIGLKFPQLQKVNTILFGVIFAAKFIWMGFTCLMEYKKCTKDLENYFDKTPNISWMYNLIWMTIILSVFTIVYFYVEAIRYPYYIFLLGIYVFLTFKVINYLPIKISNMRQESVLQEEEEEKKVKKNSVDLKEKLEGPLERWVNEKSFTKPDITIKDVALAIGTNHNYLSKYLNSIVGMTFSVWLHTLRIEESKKYLTGLEKLSIEEIGQKVGINEIYNYSRWFKTVTGMTPQNYRKANRPK